MPLPLLLSSHYGSTHSGRIVTAMLLYQHQAFLRMPNKSGNNSSTIYTCSSNNESSNFTLQ
jgi:hypothetical protein